MSTARFVLLKHLSVVVFFLASNQPPSRCEPQVFHPIVHGYVGAVPPVIPLWGQFGMYVMPVNTPLVYVFQKHPSAKPTVTNRPLAPPNFPFLFRKEEPLNDFGENLHVRPGEGQEIIGGHSPPEVIPQCGVSQLIRASPGQNQNQLNAQTRGKSSDKGTVPMISKEYGGPDLSNTTFAKYKGELIIVPTKITYGMLTQNQEAPWQVAMFTDGKFHCGASLISQRFVLTACHCVTAYKERPELLSLSIGDWDLETADDGLNVEARVQRVILHPDFNYFELQNDIALLELTNPVVYTNRIQPICLPPPDMVVEGSPMKVTGWGRNENNLLQTKLRKLVAVVIDNIECADRWVTSGAPRSLIGNGIVCMDAQFGDSCKGDSGGPAVIEHPPGSEIYVQTGIVSFGSASCTDASLPGVYTRVQNYIDWINQQMGQ